MKGMKKFFRYGSNFLVRPQTNILSAAIVIMVMIALSGVLGLIRNRVLAHFFSVETLSIYFAAFRLPEIIFEVLVFGTFSSAFIPTFTAYLSRRQRDQAWYVAAISLNFAVLIFVLLAFFIFVFARPIYRLIAPGFTLETVEEVAGLTRILILAQGFFVASYFLTGVLESLQRFLVPALAPLFYNLGIILAAIFFSSSLGIYAPVLGAVAGAFLHFFIQLPLAFHLGFRPQCRLDFSHPGVRKIGKLALPRIIELSFLQIGKNTELFLASLVSTAAYTYYTFANSLQLLPVGLFGVSIAKASLPTLSRYSAKKDWGRFKETFISSLGEILFLALPFSVFLAVLRIPVVRLTLGVSRFTWESTVQTGYTLSAFCLGIFAQSLIYLLTRAFYALHDTMTPVRVSIGSTFLAIFFGVVFILGLNLPIWSLAFSFSLAWMIQMAVLFFLLSRKFTFEERKRIWIVFFRITSASLISGGMMFFLLKILDRSAWDKKLSFLGKFGLALPTTFDRFVLDTRYTLNLLFLTFIVGFAGALTYLFLAWLLKIKEVAVFSRFLRGIRGLPRPPRPEGPITVTFDG